MASMFHDFSVHSEEDCLRFVGATNLLIEGEEGVVRVGRVIVLIFVWHVVAAAAEACDCVAGFGKMLVAKHIKEVRRYKIIGVKIRGHDSGGVLNVLASEHRAEPKTYADVRRKDVVAACATENGFQPLANLLMLGADKNYPVVWLDIAVGDAPSSIDFE